MPSAAQSRYEAYVAQSNPHKGAISLPLPHLHPLATITDDQASRDTEFKTPISLITTTNEIDQDMDGDSTRDQTEGDSKSISTSKIYTPSHTHRLSTSSMLKGKMPESPLTDSHTHDPSNPHKHPHGSSGVWGHLEEGEIPYMEFGVLEVLLEDKNGGKEGKNGAGGG